MCWETGATCGWAAGGGAGWLLCICPPAPAPASPRPNQPPAVLQDCHHGARPPALRGHLAAPQGALRLRLPRQHPRAGWRRRVGRWGGRPGRVCGQRGDTAGQPCSTEQRRRGGAVAPARPCGGGAGRRHPSAAASAAGHRARWGWGRGGQAAQRRGGQYNVRIWLAARRSSRRPSLALICAPVPAADESLDYLHFMVPCEHEARLPALFAHIKVVGGTGVVLGGCWGGAGSMPRRQHGMGSGTRQPVQQTVVRSHAWPAPPRPRRRTRRRWVWQTCSCV